MLDLNGFVSETNATNIFIIKKGCLLTPHADSCLSGITRGIILKIAEENGIPVTERNVSLSEVHSADEVFTTGTMGELAPVLKVDGRQIGIGCVGQITQKLQALYKEATENEGQPLPF